MAEGDYQDQEGLDFYPPTNGLDWEMIGVISLSAIMATLMIIGAVDVVKWALSLI